MTAWLTGFLELGDKSMWNDFARRCVKAHLHLVSEVTENKLTIANVILLQTVEDITYEDLKELVVPLCDYNYFENLYYLQGFFEISRSKEKLNSNQLMTICTTLYNNEQGLSPYLQALFFVLEDAEEYDTEQLQKDLNTFFEHEVDPSYEGYEEYGQKWQEIHDEYKKDLDQTI